MLRNLLAALIVCALALPATGQTCYDYRNHDANTSLAVAGGTVGDMVSDGTHAVIAAGPTLNWCTLDPAGMPTVAGTFVVGSGILKVALEGDLVFAACGTGGLYIVDFADPASPAQRAHVPSLDSSTGVDVEAGHCYLADGTNLRIFDLADPALPDEVATVPYTPVEFENGCNWMEVAGTRCWTAFYLGSLRCYDVTDPAAPVVLRQDSDETVYSPNIADIDLVGTRLHVLWETVGVPPWDPDLTDVVVQDVSTPDAPVIDLYRSFTGFETGAIAGTPTHTYYARAGWVHVYDLATGDEAPLIEVAADCRSLHVEQSLLWAADGTAVEIIDMDPAAGVPVLDSMTVLEIGEEELNGIVCAGDTALVAIYNEATGVGEIPSGSVHRVDIADPAALADAGSAGGWIGTSGEPFAVHADHLYVSEVAPEDREIWNWRTTTSLGSHNFGTSGNLAADGFVYSAGGSPVRWLAIWDLADPLIPTVVDTLFDDGAWSFDVAGGLLAAGVTLGGATTVELRNVVDPYAPTNLGSVPCGTSAYARVLACDTELVAAAFGGTLQLVTVDPPALGGSLALPADIRKLEVSGPVIYAAAGTTLFVVDATDPDQPVIKGRHELPANITGLALAPTAVLCSSAPDLYSLRRDCLDPGTAIVSHAGHVPVSPASWLSAPVPNPFNPTTRLAFTLPAAARAELVIYDVAGRRVRTLLDRSLGAGNIVATWNGRDDAGRAVPSGVYLVQLRAGTHRESRKLTLLK